MWGLQGNRVPFAILGIEDWEALIEWLETLEDTHIVQQAGERSPPKNPFPGVVCRLRRQTTPE